MGNVHIIVSRFSLSRTRHADTCQVKKPCHNVLHDVFLILIFCLVIDMKIFESALED